MILFFGLLMLASLCLLVGTFMLRWASVDGDPRILQMMEAGGHDIETIRTTAMTIVGVGVFLLLCALYIWNHP